MSRLTSFLPTLAVSLLPFATARGQAASEADSSTAVARSAAISAAKETIHQLRGGDIEGVERHFAEKLSRDLPASKLRDTWAGLVAMLGEPTGVDPATVDSVAPRFVIHQPIRFATMAIDAILAIDRENKVTSLGLVPVPVPVRK